MGSNGEASYDPSYFKTKTPDATSDAATSAGGIAGSCPGSTSLFNFYGAYENCNYISLDYHGYLYASQTGTYSFSISKADDFVLVWAGSVAYSGWTRSNAMIDVTLGQLNNGAGRSTGTYSAVKGQYIPLRVLFAQGNGPFEFGLQVKGPDGSVVLNQNTNLFQVKYSCDGTTAPDFPAYGSET